MKTHYFGKHGVSCSGQCHATTTNLKIYGRLIWVLFCVLALTACGQERTSEEQTSSQSQEPSEYSLSYSAGEHGRIEGPAEQSVAHGSAGVPVTAIPAEGYHFTGWSDGETTAERVATNVQGPLEVRAQFARNLYTLTYSAGANGQIEGLQEQQVLHGADGSAVTALAAEHYHFVDWSDGQTTAQRTDRTLTGDLEVKASFAPDQYTIRYSSAEGGRIEGPAEQSVAYGSAGASVTATPAEGYHFTGWNDGVTSAERVATDVQGPLEVRAQFARNLYTLSYSAGANGQIDGLQDQQVGHGDDGSAVTAVPDQHHHFAEWSDGVTTARRVDRDVTGDLQVKASFAVDRYMILYTAAEHGRIEGPVEQEVAHGGSGTAVTAVPAEGYHFTGWSDGVTLAERVETDVQGPLEVRAKFARNLYTLTYTAGANGQIEGLQEQQVEHGADGSVVIAQADLHYHFAGWSDGVTTAKRVDHDVSGDLQVTASFAVDRYAVRYTAAEHGRIEGPVEQEVAHGGSGTAVTAVPAEGYHFTGWSDGVTTAERFEKAVTGALQFEARFVPRQYPLIYTVDENGYLEGNQRQKVNHGESSEPVTAFAKPGYRFVGWSDGVESARRQEIEVVGELQIEAEFALKSYPIGGRLEGLVAGTELELQNSGSDRIVLEADGTFRFPNEVKHGQFYRVEIVTQPTMPNQTCQISDGAGRVAAAPVTDIVVSCQLNKYSIGGILIGLPAGDQLLLGLNKEDQLTLVQDGSFKFQNQLEDGSEYHVRIDRQVEKPNWICELRDAVGTLSGGPVEDVWVTCAPQLILQARPGSKRVTLTWNKEDFSGATLNMCRAREEVASSGFDSCRNYRGGTLQKAIQSPHGIGDLDNDISYWFQLQAVFPDGRETFSEAVLSIPFSGLNDTGIDWCSGSSGTRHRDGTRAEKEQSCLKLASDFPGQDGLFGRDTQARVRSLEKAGGGAGGFDFTKLCRSGEAAGERKCPPNPRPGAGYDQWACTQDNLTGLTWEIKTESGLRGRENNYPWYLSDEQRNGGNAGMQASADCAEGTCDTEAYAQKVNDMRLCGYTDWRLPTRRELLSIVDNGRINPAIDVRYFPYVRPDYYWSATPYHGQEDSAWQVYFFYGEVKSEAKTSPAAVRLVRGKTRTFGRQNLPELQAEEESTTDPEP